MTVICEITHSGHSSAFSLTFNHRSEHRGRMKQCWRFNEEGRVASVNSRLLLCGLSSLLWDDQREWGGWCGVSAGLHLARCWREALPLISAAESMLLCKKATVGRFGAGRNTLKKAPKGLETAQMWFNVHTKNENGTSRKWVALHPLCSHKMTIRDLSDSQSFDSTVRVSLLANWPCRPSLSPR